MIKALLVDDEAPVREALAQLISLYCPDIYLCTACDSIPAAVTAIRQHQPDIVLLDVEIGAGNGFDIFRHFPEPGFRVIFITAYQQYALQAFRFAALDYLLKPVDPDLLAEALKKASDGIDREKITLKIDSYLHNMSGHAKEKRIVLKTSDAIHLVSLGEIMYCEADRSYTKFYLADKSRILVSHTMGEYEELFGSQEFFRIHQSFLLNLNYFKRYEKSDGGKAILKDNTSLPVATRKKDQLLQLIARL